jgi:hypothetical protein
MKLCQSTAVWQSDTDDKLSNLSRDRRRGIGDLMVAFKGDFRGVAEAASHRMGK